MSVVEEQATTKSSSVTADHIIYTKHLIFFFALTFIGLGMGDGFAKTM